jgi:two-component system NtrC family sensor kinase
MFAYQSSIRQKIILGYYMIVAVIVGLSVFAFFELRFIEKKIIFGDVISEFFDTTLEIRRFEKNFFLYGQQADYLENIDYVEKAKGLLENNTDGFESIAFPQQIAQLKEDLRTYKGLMDLYSSGKAKEMHNEESASDPVQRMILEKTLRKVGKDIITVAEGISKTERRNIQSLLKSSQNIIVFSIFSLILLAIIIGRVLSRMVVKPLQMLEESMGIIAEGKFERVSINSHDREILSLANAFNTMLKELELRQRHIVQSEKLASLGTLLSGVAHELNNPLSNISSSCQILMEEIDDTDIPYKKELLSQIDDQTDRARNIVRSLLEFSREKVFKKETLQLRSLFDETIRFVKGQVPTNIAIVLDIPEALFIYADKQRIQQAFLNLIRNAIDAMGDTGEIYVKASRHSAMDKVEEEAEIYNYLKYHGKCTLEEDTVDIMIRDNGPGIPEEILLKIFDPFFTTKDVGKGSGLGLFIVHEIIEEHDGCIAVDSTVQKGTTFLIRLPFRKALPEK